jgi:hypothetical protein
MLRGSSPQLFNTSQGDGDGLNHGCEGLKVIVMDFVAVSAATQTPTSRKRPERQTRAGSVRAKSWSGFPGFGQMVP